MWQAVRELSQSLGRRYAADQVFQLPAGQDVTGACRPELAGNLSKAWLDFKPVFFSLLTHLGMGWVCQNPNTTSFIQKAMGLLLLSCCLFQVFRKSLKNGSPKRSPPSILPPVSWFIKERQLSVSIKAIQKPWKFALTMIWHHKPPTTHTQNPHLGRILHWTRARMCVIGLWIQWLQKKINMPKGKGCSKNSLVFSYILVLFETIFMQKNSLQAQVFKERLWDVLP